MTGARRLVAVAVAVACVVGGAAGAGALTGSIDPRPLTGCLGSTGGLEAVALGTAPLRSCAAGETQVSWGVPGPTGPRGPTGPPGPAGISGPGRLSQEVIVSYDDMDEDATGWSYQKRLPWNRVGDSALWLYGESEAEKSVSLPSHDTVRIQADIGFLDRWRGQVAYIKVDDRVVWLRRGQVCSLPCKGLNVAFDEFYNDEVGQLVDVTVAHTDPMVTVKIGSTLRDREDNLNASYMIDNVTVSVGQSSRR